MELVKISIYILVCFRAITKACECNLNEMIKETVLNHSFVMEKRQLPEEVFSGEIIAEPETTEETVADTESSTEKITRTKVAGYKLITEKTNPLESLCPYYKEMPAFNFDKMVDVWQLAFYKVSEKLSCFKIHIKKTSMENRKLWHNKFGDFNGTIDWTNCQLEVASTSSKNANPDQRHFLQGTEKQGGVLENIIVTREDGGEITLIEQSPDQWALVNNLLLMRDCENGDVVVFSRLPVQPTSIEIEEALESFGEDSVNGTIACEPLKDKYQIIS